MFKHLKWNSIDFFQRYSLLFVGMVLSLILSLIRVNSNTLWSGLILTLSGLFGFVSFLAALVLAVNTCFTWLTRDSYLLELTNPIPTWKILLSKFLVAAGINGLACLFILQISLLWSNYQGVGYSFLTNAHLKGIPSLVLFLLLVDCTIAFSYILVKSFRGFRKFSFLFTGLMSALLLTVIVSVCMLIMTANGMMVLPEISGENILSLSGSLNVYSSLFPVIFSGVVIALEFICSSLLLSRRFQRD